MNSSLFCAAGENTCEQIICVERQRMFYWKSKSFIILLLTFSGFNLIRSDCGADVNGFCASRDLQRFNSNSNSKDQLLQRIQSNRRGKLKDFI